MNLAIDIGNTHIKAAVFEGEVLVETFKSRSADRAFIEAVLKIYPGIDKVILASVRRDIAEVEEAVKKRVKRYTRFDGTKKVPIKNLYATPETLGPDRLAAAVGANAIYPDSNVMIVDFGTAITIDLVTQRGEFLGGNISPGVDVRFQSLHERTANLPLCEDTGRTVLLGTTSEEAICSGVLNGVLYEIEGYVMRLESEYEELRIIFTGGDGKYFAERLKNTIFVTYDLVVHGLNRIMEHNED
ncbi:MAG: type III pantothenate kinase [Rikenellaceae bacterium]|nr:type III pantothenate kinase [Rikenellaceae bacterium]MCL2692122.1 type III pantothenate kinase [Rikenellaceae bacterium]